MNTVRGFLGNFSDIVSNQLTVGPMSFLELRPLPLQPGLGWVGHTHLEAAVWPFLSPYPAWTVPIPHACSTVPLPSPPTQVTLLPMEAFPGASPLMSLERAND